MSLKYKRPYIFSVVLFVFITLLFYSCKKEKNVAITFEEENSIIEDSVLVELNLIKASGDKSLSKKINETIEARVIEGLQLEIDEAMPKSIDEAINSFKKQYAILNQEFDENSLNFEATFDTELLTNTEDIVCIALTSYINTGGAHGNSYIKLLNFDKRSQNQLKTDELIKEEDAFFTLYRTHFIKNVKKQFPNLNFEQEDYITLPENIGFNADGILFLYNNYELNFLGQEIFEFVISFEEINEYLNYQP